MTLEQLTSVLARYPAIVRPLSAPEPLGNAGGSSGVQLWRFRSGQGELVARAWPPEETEPERVRQIHRWLAEAVPLGYIPVAVPDLVGETVQVAEGRLWDVSRWLPGRPDLACPPRPARLRAGFAALASFHQVLARYCRTGPSPGLRKRLVELESLSGGGFGVLSAAVEPARNDLNRAAALDWLALARRLAPRALEPLHHAAAHSYRLQPCVRDVRPEHLLFEGDRITGLIDFGAMATDLVAGDVARLLAEWVDGNQSARVKALEAYASIRPLDDQELMLVGVYESSNAVLGAARWVRWHFVERRTFDDPHAVSRGLERGVARLAQFSALAER